MTTVDAHRKFPGWRPAMKPTRILVATLVSGLLAAAGVVAATGPASAANLLANPGFETGTLSGWSCSGSTVISSPVHSGTRALAATPAGSDYARCAQTVSVLPNTAYTLSAWV